MSLTPLEQFQILKLLSLFFLNLDLSVTNFLIINFLTLVFFISVVYSTSIKQKTKNQTAFFLIPNSWQVFVETMHDDVSSQLLFNNVNVEGEKYFPCMSMIFVFIIFNRRLQVFSYGFIVLMFKFMQKTNFWQTGYLDPAGISMEGVSVFNKHLPFLLIVIVFFVWWLFVCTVYYFVEFRNRKNCKFVHSKELKNVWRTAPTSLFFFLALIAAAIGNWDITTTLLEEVPIEQPASTPINPFHGKTPVNPYNITTQETVDKAVLDELEQIFRFFKAKGYTVRRVLNVLYAVPDSFWSQNFWEKVATVEESLQKEDAVNVIPLEISFLLSASFGLIFLVIFLRPGCGGG